MRRWLALYALSITSVVVVAFLVPLAVLIRDLASDRAMSAAERQAQTIARFAATVEDDSLALAALAPAISTVGGTSLVLTDGAVVGTELPAGLDLQAARDQGRAYRQPLDDGQAVVVPVLRAAGPSWVVVVAVPVAELRRNVASSWLVLGVLGVMLVALALVVADRMGRAVVKPIGDLVAATHRLGRGDLTVEVEPAGPEELAEVGTAFNSLTGRVRTLMDQERETAADLSHRLRTPLTALKLDVEALAGEADVGKLTRDVDELERVVTHVISEARRPLREGGGVVADLASIVRERSEFWGFLAEDQSRRWTLDIALDRCPVRGSRADFEATLDALLGNVFAHTEPGTPYRVSLQPADGGMVELIVADGGPGIEQPEMLERGASGSGSTGLGIDIVRRSAEAAGGSARWECPQDSGTVVRLTLPVVAPG